MEKVDRHKAIVKSVLEEIHAIIVLAFHAPHRRQLISEFAQG